MQVAELHRRLARHRATLHGALANRLLGHGADIMCESLDYVAWQKNFPRSVRDRAPGLLVEMMRRRAGRRRWCSSPISTALTRPRCRKPVCAGGETEEAAFATGHRGCDVTEDRDLFSAYLGLHVRTGGRSGRIGWICRQPHRGWLHRQDVDRLPK